MKYLEDGVHRFSGRRIFDWAANTYSSPVLVVGSLSLPPPGRAYLYDFAFSVAEGVEQGAVAMNKFEGTEDAVSAVSAALEPFGVPAAAVGDFNVLYCKSAAYHEDSAFNTVFVTAHWHGATGDVVFPRWGARVRMAPGRFIAFDCHEPHAFLKEGASTWNPADYAEQGYSHLISLDMDRCDENLRELFELDDKPAAGHALDIRSVQLCQETGNYQSLARR